MGELRRYQRIEVEGLSADVSDGVGFFSGVISDVSRYGIGLDDLPKRIDDSVGKMTLVITGHGRNFKMLVKPKWAEREGIRKKIGFEIISTPLAWTNFVMKFEPEVDSDALDVVNL